MPCQSSNHSDVDLSSLEPHVQGMYDFFDQKIGFKKPPTMHFDSDPNNQSNVLGKTAYYDPSSLEIHVFTDGRHPKDMLRSIAHELIHHQQNLEDRLNVGGYMGQGYYLQNEAMKELEQEAMLEGNALMREYEDTTKSEEMNKMSLKEWKNNELNKLLLEKFGILKEDKMPMKNDDEDADNDGSTDDKVPAFLKEEDEEEVEEEELNESGNDLADKRMAASKEIRRLKSNQDQMSPEDYQSQISKQWDIYRAIKKQEDDELDGPDGEFSKPAVKDWDKVRSPLQEALNKILNAKSITLKSSGKKIK